MNQELRIKSFTDLIAWQKGHKLVVKIYTITKTFPKDELYGIVSQIRRAAVSITSNLAEGFTRESYQEKARFYNISHASLTELQNQILISRDVDYLPSNQFDDLAKDMTEVHKLITGLVKKTKELAV